MPPLLGQASLPQVTGTMANALQAPTFRLITLGNDATATQVQTFLTSLGKSNYWKQVTSEYGISAASAGTAEVSNATVGNPITAGSVLASQASDIENLILAGFSGTQPTWGAVDNNTLAIVWTPQGVPVAPDPNTPDACAANIFAWHSALELSNGTVLPYVVVPDCGTLLSLDNFNSRTFAASHAILGAVTNPRGTGLGHVDTAHDAWQLAAGGGEVADLCVAQLYENPNIAFTAADMPFAVQRSWSNGVAQVGGPPCLPATAADAFGASAVTPDTVNVFVAHAQQTTQGVHIAPGATGTVTLGLHGVSTMPKWQVQVAEVGTSWLTIAPTSVSGQAGDKVQITVSVSSDAIAGDQQIVRLTSTLNGVSETEWLVIGN